MKKTNAKLYLGLLILGLGGLLSKIFGADASTAPAPDELLQRISALEQQVQGMQTQQTNTQTAVSKITKNSPVFTAGPGGFGFSSPDTNFAIMFHGYIQADSRTFFDDGNIKGNDSLGLRRARPILQGTVFRDFDFMFMPDFGGTTVQIQDAYIVYRYRPELQFQGGKFKSPVGLEELQADTVTSFNERSMVTDLMPNRDNGFALRGDIFKGAVKYIAGVFNGAPDYNGTTTNADYDDNKAFVGRVFFQPFKQTSMTALQGFGFGLGGSYEVDRAATNTATGLTPGYVTDGQQKFFSYTNGTFASGQHWRLSPQASYYWGRLGVMGEYAISDQAVKRGTTSADLRNTAWEVSGGVMLTDDDAAYTGVVPNHPFDIKKNQWGAWQVVGRYDKLDVDNKAFPLFADRNTSATQAQGWSVGLNWILNRNVTVMTSFSRTTFDGGNGPKATVTRQPEQVFFTRLQLSF